MHPLRIVMIATALTVTVEQGRSAERSHVRALLDAAASAPSREAQQAAFGRLEALGCAAVPELAQSVGDRRPLPYAALSLRNNSPGAFEAVRHYAPTVVGEAVAALLNQITGRHFGAVYNGATEAELRDAASQWQEYVLTTPTGAWCSLRNEQSNTPVQTDRAPRGG